MLHEFLQMNRQTILSLTEQKTKNLAGPREASEQLRKGLPLFYEQLIKVLEQKLNQRAPNEMLLAAASHGREFLTLGYSLSHVVHAYGAMCQAITELATIKNADISPREFNILNACLDVAIASAVSEFQFQSNEASDAREIKHLGFLAHELRNALSSATVAHEMIKAGLVGIGGSTARVLEANLTRMRHLIERSLSEVRMRADSDLFIENFRLADLFDQVVVTANVDAAKRSQTLLVEVDWKIEVDADRQFILSAVANLVQNAIKYTKSEGTIWLRGKLENQRVIIEVEDQCGGLETSMIRSLFKPYVQENADRSGLGLGLSITQRAIHLSQGTIEVQNTVGTGCSIIVNIPQHLSTPPSNKTA
ncbi:MAG: HAMP domain-containing histidine kinase, partial [Bdellovibrionales bacterium]|nr:HAMP domain-containing histidine kinase [Bdellovibrionales bacterium]